RYPEVAAVVPRGDYRFLSGKEFLEKFPEGAQAMAEAITNQIRELPNTGLLADRPDLARFLPPRDFGHQSGKELLEKDYALTDEIAEKVKKEIGKLQRLENNWGLIGLIGLNRKIESWDEKVRSPFLPYGLSGIMVAAAAVFFAYIGFDAISTHSEEAR